MAEDSMAKDLQRVSDELTRHKARKTEVRFSEDIHVVSFNKWKTKAYFHPGKRDAAVSEQDYDNEVLQAGSEGWQADEPLILPGARIEPQPVPMREPDMAGVDPISHRDTRRGRVIMSISEQELLEWDEEVSKEVRANSAWEEVDRRLMRLEPWLNDEDRCTVEALIEQIMEEEQQPEYRKTADRKSVV